MEMAPTSLLSDARVRCRASSVLDRDRAQFGADNALPAAPADACWASAQGSPQRLQLALGRAVRATELRVMFQGGFSALRLKVHARRSGRWDAADCVCDAEPRDSSESQSFQLQRSDEPLDAVSLTFERSSDLYGRVIVYSLDVLGWEGDLSREDS